MCEVTEGIVKELGLQLTSGESWSGVYYWSVSLHPHGSLICNTEATQLFEVLFV